MISTNPKQAAKTASEALALLQTISEKPKQETVQFLTELENKGRLADQKITELKNLTNIVDTLAEAEQIRGDADRHKSDTVEVCRTMKLKAENEAEEILDKADAVLTDAENQKKRAEEITGPLEDAYQEKIKSLADRERAVAQKEVQSRDRDQELDRRERELQEKVKEASNIFA